MKREVFLGGTCNNSNWRNELIPLLNIDYFNPVVDDWTEEAQQLEKEKRETCDYVLYVITPKMKGVYSIAESVQDSNIRPEKTIFCVLTEDEDDKFDDFQIKSLDQVKEMVRSNGAKVFDTLEEIAEYLNNETTLVESISIWKKYNENILIPRNIDKRKDQFKNKILELINKGVLKNKIDDLIDDDEHYMSNDTNTLDVYGIIIRKFDNGYGIQFLSKLDNGYPLDIVKNYNEIIEWIKNHV